MSDQVARIRMFAGPNGSGKTTVKNGLHRVPAWFGVYVNPDELQRTLNDLGVLALADFSISSDADQVRNFLRNSRLLAATGLKDLDREVLVSNGVLSFPGLAVNSYLASVISDFVRKTLVSNGASFSFETVMSSPDKVELFRTAKNLGYRTYLYYVATEDPVINIGRVAHRVSQGGHPVPQDKIVSRYSRSLDLLSEAIRHSDRAFFFDTSGIAPWFFSEVSSGTQIDLKGKEMPQWFRRSVWDKF